MSLEDKLEQHIGALEANTEILQKLYNLKVGDVDNVDEAKKRIGKAESEMGEDTPKKQSKKKSSKKGARKTAPAESAVTIEKVKEHLTVLDRESAKAVLAKFKVKKLSELEPEHFEAAIVEADSYVAKPAEDEDDDDLFG